MDNFAGGGIRTKRKLIVPMDRKGSPLLSLFIINRYKRKGAIMLFSAERSEVTERFHKEFLSLPVLSTCPLHTSSRHRRYFQHARFIPIVGVGKRGEY